MISFCFSLLGRQGAFELLARVEKPVLEATYAIAFPHIFRK